MNENALIFIFFFTAILYLFRKYHCLFPSSQMFFSLPKKCIRTIQEWPLTLRHERDLQKVLFYQRNNQMRMELNFLEVFSIKIRK